MYECMSVLMCVCMAAHRCHSLCLCIPVYQQACMYVCMDGWMGVHMDVHVCMYAACIFSRPLCVCACLYECMPACLYARMPA